MHGKICAMRNPFTPIKAFFARTGTSAGSAPATKSGGGAGQLPPVAPPKVANKQVSFASYLKTVTATSAQLARTDLNVANLDIASVARSNASTPAVIRALIRSNPDLSAAASAFIRTGIPEGFKLAARNGDGSLNRDATQLAMEIAARMDLMPDYVNGFSQVSSLRSISEALAKQLLTNGACACELVLDKSRMPLKFNPVAVEQIIWFPDAPGVRPVQRLGGIDTDLDIPTFFYTALDADVLDAYAQSPFEAAVQPVLAGTTFLSDLRRVCARHVYPRYDLSINEEKLRARIPPDILNDKDKTAAYLNTVIADIESVINGLGVEEALIHFDFFEVKFVEGGSTDVPNTFDTVKSIFDEKIATGAKVMPSILGHGSGSQNVASTETMLFLTSANGMIRLKLNEIYSKAFTLAVRLFGLDVTVEFCFDTIELRPSSELEAFRAMKQSRVLEQLSYGFITDDEAALELTGRLTPTGFKPLSGTGFFSAPAVNPNNPLGNQQGALQQGIKSDAPAAPKGPAKKAQLYEVP